MSDNWPPPIGTRVTVRSMCCGVNMAETAFEWDGTNRQFTTQTCPYNEYGYHQPSISATWAVTDEVTE